MFEGGSMPLEVLALSVPWVGARLVDLMARYQNLALFGFMIEDTSRGEVRPGLRGSPLIVYNLNRRDVARMQKRDGNPVRGVPRGRRQARLPDGAGDGGAIDAGGGATACARCACAPSAFDVTAYHPLGTCRMGTDPRTSVVGPDFETHEVERLFVADGSAVPAPLGVNPQMTIMAMALRAAEIVDRRLAA